MKPIDASAMIENLNWRYAVKAFDASKKIPEGTWKQIEQAMVLSPSSYGLQPYRFITVSDAGLRAKLRPVSWNQSQITDASHMVVFAAKDEMVPADIHAYVDRIMEVRGGGMNPGLAGYRDMMLGGLAKPEQAPGGNWKTYTRAQAYIALGFALFAASQLGVDACPMEGIDGGQYDEILGLKGSGFSSVVVGTFGYRSSSDWLANLKKVRAAESTLFIRK
jgi:nitroreductase